MERKAKDCMNCKHFKPCIEQGLNSYLDKRQVRKLTRESDEYGNWTRFYCKKHKYKRR